MPWETRMIALSALRELRRAEKRRKEEILEDAERVGLMVEVDPQIVKLFGPDAVAAAQPLVMPHQVPLTGGHHTD